MFQAQEIKPPAERFMAHVLRGFDSATSRRSQRSRTFEDFCRDRLKVRSKTGVLLPFNPWPIQQVYLQKSAAGKAQHFRNEIILKFRQGGITTIKQAQSYRHVVENPLARAMTVAHTDEATQTIFETALLFYEEDPYRPARRGESGKRLRFNELQSSFTIRTARARGSIRGTTIDRAHLSEVAWWFEGPRQSQMVLNAIAGYRAATNLEMCLESTPNGINAFKTLWDDAKGGRNDLYPIFLAWFDDPLNAHPDGSFDPQDFLPSNLSEDEARLVAAHNLTPNQLAFRRAKQREYGELFPQEFPEDDITCFLVTGHGFFSAFLIREIMSRERAARGLSGGILRTEQVPGGLIEFYQEPMPFIEYCIGSDPSEGTASGDPNGGAVIRCDTGETVADFHGQWTPLEHYHLGDRLGRRYNNAWWAVERENFGHTIISYQIDKGYPRPFYSPDDGKPGWSTNGKTRPMMLNTLREFMIAAPGLVHNLELCNEALTFRKQHDGKYAADSGAHDDRVMKYAIAHRARIDRPASPSFTPIR